MSEVPPTMMSGSRAALVACALPQTPSPTHRATSGNQALRCRCTPEIPVPPEIRRKEAKRLLHETERSNQAFATVTVFKRGQFCLDRKYRHTGSVLLLNQGQIFLSPEHTPPFPTLWSTLYENGAKVYNHRRQFFVFQNSQPLRLAVLLSALPHDACPESTHVTDPRRENHRCARPQDGFPPSRCPCSIFFCFFWGAIHGGELRLELGRIDLVSAAH